MTNIKFVCKGCKNRCEVEIDFEGQDNVEIKGNGCMRGVLYAQEKIKNAVEEN